MGTYFHLPLELQELACCLERWNAGLSATAEPRLSTFDDWFKRLSSLKHVDVEPASDHLLDELNKEIQKALDVYDKHPAATGEVPANAAASHQASLHTRPARDAAAGDVPAEGVVSQPPSHTPPASDAAVDDVPADGATSQQPPPNKPPASDAAVDDVLAEGAVSQQVPPHTPPSSDVAAVGVPATGASSRQQSSHTSPASDAGVNDVVAAGAASQQPPPHTPPASDAAADDVPAEGAASRQVPPHTPPSSEAAAGAVPAGGTATRQIPPQTSITATEPHPEGQAGQAQAVHQGARTSASRSAHISGQYSASNNPRGFAPERPIGPGQFLRGVSWKEDEAFIALFEVVTATPRKIKRVVNV